MKKILQYIFYIIVALTALVILYVFSAPQFGSNLSKIQKQQYKSFSNFEDDSFKNIEYTPVMTGEVSTWDFFKKDSNRQPIRDIIPEKFDYSKFKNISNRQYFISWLGHSAFIINISGSIVMLDPMLGSHAAPVPIPSLKRYNSVNPIDIDSLDTIDYVLISHDHYDHLDYSTIKKIRKKVNYFIVPLGVDNHLKKWGISSEKIISLNWNQNYESNDINFICLPARHYSGRGAFNKNSTLWSSWAIKSPIVKIYFSGDSGYGKHIKKIGSDHGPFDISFIDCGQYNKAWKYAHMFPEEAVLAALELKSNYFMPIHWGAFTLALHPWDEPVEESIKYSRAMGLKCITPRIGSLVSDETLDGKNDLWWKNF